MQTSTSDNRSTSVIIPCFNCGDLINDSVRSILSQNGQFSVIEIIIVDDASTDASTKAAFERIKCVPKVRIIDNAGKKGPAGARNTGAFAAKGNWLAFLDADDLWLPDSLAVRFAALDMHPDARFISGDFQIWDSDTGAIEDNFFRTRPKTSFFYGPAYQQESPIRLPRPFRDTLFTALCSSCSILVKRDLFIEVRGFEESLMYKEDHHLWFKLSKLTDLILVPQSVFHYRQHGSNMTKRECTPFEYERTMLDFVQQSETLPGLRREIDARYTKGFAADAQWFRAHGRFRSALSASWAGLKRAPTDANLWRQFVASLLHVR